MILRRLGFSIFVLVQLVAFSTASFAENNGLVTFLYVGEPAPRDAVKISRQTFSGNDITKECSYYELLQKVKDIAKTQSANLVKVDSRRERSQKFDCEEIAITFYKVADVQRWEKHISWSKDRKLTWDDFKGPVPANAPSRYAAVTAAGIAIETNTATSSNPPKVFVYNTFETTTSWVKPDHKTSDILKHEQTHFDICELYTRKMRQRFAQEKISVNNLPQLIRSIYHPTFKEQIDRQNKYEEETQHGVIDDAQNKWTDQINEELSKTEEWSSR